MGEKRPCVYILASQRNGTLYVGVTSDLPQRTWQHRTDAAEGFTKKYGVHILVYVEFRSTMAAAILREKQIKRWRRAWKLALIERDNPQCATFMMICRRSVLWRAVAAVFPGGNRPSLALGPRFRGDDGEMIGRTS